MRGDWGGDARGTLRTSDWRTGAFSMTVIVVVRNSGSRIPGGTEIASLVSLSHW